MAGCLIWFYTHTRTKRERWRVVMGGTTCKIQLDGFIINRIESLGSHRVICVPCVGVWCKFVCNSFAIPKAGHLLCTHKHKHTYNTLAHNPIEHVFTLRQRQRRCRHQRRVTMRIGSRIDGCQYIHRTHRRCVCACRLSRCLSIGSGYGLCEPYTFVSPGPIPMPRPIFGRSPKPETMQRERARVKKHRTGFG